MFAAEPRRSTVSPGPSRDVSGAPPRRREGTGRYALASATSGYGSVNGPALKGLAAHARQCSCGGTCPRCRAAALAGRVQFSLTVAPAHDGYEREAEAVAADVVRAPEPPAQVAETRGGVPSVETRRAISSLPRRRALVVATSTFPVQRQVESAATEGGTMPVPGRGQPLPGASRAFFESRFGHRFDDVRIHTDRHAQGSARELGARAYTMGTDVVFGAGEYDPSSVRGQRLLAHELTHVVQQGGHGGVIQRSTKAKTPCAIHVYDASNPKDDAVIPDDKSGIGVASVPDMISKVNAYVADDKNACSCISRLEINGHGTDGYQSVGNGGLYVNDEKAIVHDSKDEHLESLKKIKFCERALFMLMGCHVGGGAGKVLLSKLANLLPGKLVGGAQHYTAGTGLGKKKVTGEGDKPGQPLKKRDPFLTSRFVRWHIVIGDKEYVIPGDETDSPDAKSKLKAADKIKVKTPDGVEVIK
ncbi:MAG: DUF4157 domain-containing protein [Gemmatimonas sp.]|nr:DUF4157 domain-containing protein [Gemmatimonas sp.]